LKAEEKLTVYPFDIAKMSLRIGEHGHVDGEVGYR
jgi:hypothetical protein